MFPALSTATAEACLRGHAAKSSRLGGDPNWSVWRPVRSETQVPSTSTVIPDWDG